MRIISTSIICLLLPTIALAQGQVLNKTLVHEDVERTYNLFIPSSYSASEVTPLVLNMHGVWGNADQQMATSTMNEVAEEEGFLVAYPNAVDGDWRISADFNLSFIDTLLATIGSELSVDTERIYATGYSQGALMSYLLAVSRPDTFAAIAPVAGILPESPEDVPRVPSRPAPLMHINGTADVLVPYGGGGVPLPGFEDVVAPAFEDTLNEWVTNNGCDVTPSVVDLPNVSADDGSTVTVLSFGDCDTYRSVDGDEIEANVVHYRVNGGGHSWPILDADREAALTAFEETYGPDLLAAYNPLNSDFNASAEIWGFFQQHVSPVPEQPPLQAGDADQNSRFDQFDLIQVQQAAKYLTGEAATWGEGDWNGAPGGRPGNPPAGDGLFDQEDIVAAQQNNLYAAGPYAAVKPNGMASDAQTSVGYNAGTGEVWVDTPAGHELTSINIDSASGIFTGDAAANLGGSFDNDAADNIFKATFGSSFGSLSFSNVAQAGLSEEFLSSDLTVVGSLAGGGDLGEVDLVYVPEPASALLLALGLVVGIVYVRRAGCRT